MKFNQIESGGPSFVQLNAPWLRYVVCASLLLGYIAMSHNLGYASSVFSAIPIWVISLALAICGIGAMIATFQVKSKSSKIVRVVAIPIGLALAAVTYLA